MTFSPLPVADNSAAPHGSGPVLRQYIAPTCKLEISAKPSPLERWTRKPILKNQRFLLKFEDPRLSEDQWMTLRGDRIKLEALTEAVSSYVQTFLQQSRTLTQPEAESNLLTEPQITEVPLASTNYGITLQPKGLLAHTLILGSIATDSTGESLSLTSTQLADLASVLDEHSNATLSLPALNRDTAWMRSPTAWGKIAALSLLSVGVTASVLNQFSPKKEVPTQIASQASSSDQRMTPPQISQPTPSVSIAPGTSFPGIQPPPIAANSAPSTADFGNSNSPPSEANPPSEAPTNPTQPPENTASRNSSKSSPTNAKPTNPVNTSQPDNLAANNKGADTANLRVYPVPAISQPQASNSKSAPKTSNQEAPDTDPLPLDLTAQIEGIQGQVSKQWKPPEKFSKELTYLVEVSPSGTVLSVTPEGESIPAAQPVLPSVGQSIAPVLSSSKSPYTVRIFLFPDGTVSVKKA
jgi:Domain of unknown function (DUF4335)